MNAIVKRAIVGGVVSTIVMGTGTFILGQISGYKALELLKNSMSGINMLCNTVILGSTTILALMLTLLAKPVFRIQTDRQALPGCAYDRKI